MADIKFSILIPAFKRAFLEECISSILDQTYNNFEIIIVNDASPEDLGSVVESFDDQRIKYFVNEANYGAERVVENWNRCLSLSSGDYVICMGDDDKLCPNCLEVYERLIKSRPGIGLLHGWTHIIDENSEVVGATTHRCPEESAMSLLWHRVSAYGEQYIGDFCFNSSYLKEDGGFYYLPMAWGSDEISSIRAAAHNGVLNTQEVVFEYRVNSRTISCSGNEEVKLKATVLLNNWISDFLGQTCNSEEDELYRKGLLRTWPEYLETRKRVLLVHDIRRKPFRRFFYWLPKRRELGIRRGILLYALVRSYIMK